MMKHKDYEPIKFEFFQTDMEKIMYFLENVERTPLAKLGQMRNKIKSDLQHKINIHKERGEWK